MQELSLSENNELIELDDDMFAFVAGADGGDTGRVIDPWG